MIAFAREERGIELLRMDVRPSRRAVVENEGRSEEEFAD
jgi:hypothetical protein